MPSDPPGSSSRQARWTFWPLLGAAAVCPIAAAAMVRFVPETLAQSAVLSVGSLCGLMVGQLVGFRRRSLKQFIVGPVCAFLAGVADLKVFIWLFLSIGVPISVGSLIPVFGFLLGLWIAALQTSWARRVLVITALATCDFACRWIWATFVVDNISNGPVPVWILESMVYTPVAILTFVLAGISASKKVTGDDETELQADQSVQSTSTAD